MKMETKEQAIQRRKGTQLVTLKNGAEEVLALVTVTMASLDAISRQGKGVVVFELVELCRNPNHKPWGDTGDELKEWKLATCDIEGRWEVHDSIRNIVLSAAKGEGLDMEIGNPVKAKGGAE